MPGTEWCYSHDPSEARARERRRNASKGGRSGGRGRGGSGELASIKLQLSEMVDMVLTGTVPTAPYAVANQILNTRLRAVELERKLKETEELEARVEDLERAAKHQKGGSKWVG